MSANVATFKDYKPAYLKRRITQADATPRADSILSDMADGNLVTEFFFSFAGFDYQESHLVLTLIGIMGDGQDSVELYDKDVARIAGCGERTVQRWRKAYMEKAQAKSFWPMGIEQGAYVTGEKRFLPTKYRITFTEALEQAVATARASVEYQSDRLQAIEKAARLFYDDIPQAPPKFRKGRKQSIQTPLSHLNGAARKIASAQTSLKDMPEEQRAAFINWHGQELQNALEDMRAQMAELELALSRVANKGLSYRHDILSGIPLNDENVSGSVAPNIEEGTTQAEPEREHTPEDFAAWDSFCAPLLQPKVTQTDVVIESHAPTDAPPEPPPPELQYIADDSCSAPETEATLTEFDADELAEAEAMRLEACGKLEDERRIE
jgi:hypothetical protein